MAAVAMTNNDYWLEWPTARPEELAMSKNRPANRTMPAADPTGRRPPKQAAPARNQSPVPGAGPIRKVKVTGRDPRRRGG